MAVRLQARAKERRQEVKERRQLWVRESLIKKELIEESINS